MDYKSAGVDTDSHKLALDKVKDKIRRTFGKRVVGDVGHFGGLYEVPGDPSRVLVATTDGLGTKVHLLATLGFHDRVGRDLVNHCLNDIGVMGATPLFFLDYIAGASLTPTILAPLLDGFAEACLGEHVSLIGGETAEMPGVYEPGCYDVAGFLVGIVARSEIMDGHDIRPGDRILGFPSNGLHTNGYSLATRALFDAGGLTPASAMPDGGGTVGDALAATHVSYRRELDALRTLARGFAHITGGGLVENVPRILPAGCDAVFRRTRWDVPSIFPLIQECGHVDPVEMDRVFNMGLGMVAVIPEGSLAEAEHALHGQDLACCVAGEIVPGTGEARIVDE
ncbi:MAG: phosphoribosylformylglycinamidine cyclo-ligase [Gemmatimonadetes bacterium]|nr:phosphoribosylformylglycinamidine cyclo-ligase [Gemmatimonadota bacterium]